MSENLKPKPEVILGGSFFMPSYAMISADPRKSDRWEIAVGKSGRRWLYQREGSTVWVEESPNRQSKFRGCGGRTITFHLVDGSTVELEGPWCSNSDSCFADTGVDVRRNHITWGCIGTERLYDDNGHRPGIGNLIWFDPEPVKGFFHRVEYLAWKMHLENPDIKLYAYQESHGGSSLGPVTHEPFQLRTARNAEARERVLAEIMAS